MRNDSFTMMEKRIDQTPSSDTESDFDLVSDSAVREHDEGVLREEVERERLLIKPSKSSALRSIFSGSGYDDDAQDISDPNRGTTRKEKRQQRRRERRTRKRRREGQQDEQGELLYEMEEGGEEDYPSSASSQNSPDPFNEKKLSAPNRTRRRRLILIFLIPTLLAILSLLFYGAYRSSKSTSQTTSTTPQAPPIILSNGTSTFLPTTILISLDGFRADFLTRNLTPTLNSFIANGVSPQYMLPSFPSVTFPNHYTMVTGLYPESHGVVGNTFWDPSLNEEFINTDPARNMLSKWWAEAEPIWVTAEQQGVRTAIHMWPGSEAHLSAFGAAGIEVVPAFLDKYNGKEALERKVDRILELLDHPSELDVSVLPIEPIRRPQLIAAYVPNVDTHGHSDGPNSTAIRGVISSVDSMLGDLFAGLEARNLSDIVNVVVVSDHGMASTSVDRLLQYEDLVDPALIAHRDGWPLYGLRVNDPVDLSGIHASLKAKAKDNPNFDVYLKDKDMPERFHFSQNERIAPLWIVPKAGWAIVTKDEFDVKEAQKEGKEYHLRGLHGYDHEHPLMRAIFVARGPAFPHEAGSRLEPFQNINVYNIICDSVGVQPRPNNGSLRLPLKPVGLHSDFPPQESLDEEVQPSATVAISSSPSAVLASTPQPLSPTAITASPASPSITSVEPANEAKPTPSSEGETAAPVEEHDGGEAEEEKEEEEIHAELSWWASLLKKIEEAKAWLHDAVEKFKADKEKKGEGEDVDGGGKKGR